MADYKEQREEERFPVGPHVVCSFASPVLEDFGPVRIKSISTHGVGMIAPATLAENMLLVVKLVNPTKKLSKTALVRVAHVAPHAAGTCLVGGNLDTLLTYEELCSLERSEKMTVWHESS